MSDNHEDPIDARIKLHLAAQEHRIATIIREEIHAAISEFNTAFVDDDPQGHRTYHETQVKFMESRIKLWEDIRNKTLTGVIWTFLIAFGASAIEYAKIKLGIKP